MSVGLFTAPPRPGKRQIQLVGPIKMPDADVDTVLGALELYTGRTILRPAGLPAATYNLIILKPIPKSEAILAIETVLQLNGIGVAPLGDRFLKVVALQFVRTEAPMMITGSTLDLPPSGRIATKIFMLNFLRVAEFIPQIQASILSLNIGAGVVQLPNANAALITDPQQPPARRAPAPELDQPVTAGLQPKFYPLHNAKASDLVNKITAILKRPLSRPSWGRHHLSADDRTNQVILIADPRQYPFFDELIAKLDMKPTPTRATRSSPEARHFRRTWPPCSAVWSPARTTAAQGPTARTRPARWRPQPDRAPARRAPRSPAPTASTASWPAMPPGRTGHSSEFSSLITVLADDRSNSIVVSGTVDDIRLIREIVDKVDVLLAQVSIQVVIAEVTLTDTDVSGISALNLTVGRTGQRRRGTPSPISPAPSRNRRVDITEGWSIPLVRRRPRQHRLQEQREGAVGQHHRHRAQQAGGVRRQPAAADHHRITSTPAASARPTADHEFHGHLQGHRHRREGHAADRRRRQRPAGDRPEGRRQGRQRHGRRQRPARSSATAKPRRSSMSATAR
jgi:general secretion pathway protein D